MQDTKVRLDKNPVNYPTKIKVIGVGGAGGNAINTMIERGIDGPEFIVVNTDTTDLEKSLAENRLHIGEKLTGGKGAGAMPEVGRDAALESKEAIEKELENTDMLFIAAGFGGGTGTGASPIIAEIAKKKDILTLGIFTKPTSIEGGRRLKNFNEGFNEIIKYIDSYIIIPNQKLIEISEDMGVFEVFKKADSVIYEAVKAMSDIINKSGYINVDFADVKSVLANKGCALMGTGIAEGENRAAEAANLAISNPLLSDVKLNGCSSVLINVTVGEDMKYCEFEEVSAIINNETGSAENTIIGLVKDQEMTGKVCVTIFASGLPNGFERMPDPTDPRKDTDTPPALQEIFTRIHRSSPNDLDNIKSVNTNNPKPKNSKNEIEIPSFMRRFTD
ncbi:MAG: cell division protein FtsZ [Candidatus Cloacimonas sp.]|nr:cell division protein FtsZ [Candidatus Cloacimonadota bacterium]